MCAPVHTGKWYCTCKCGCRSCVLWSKHEWECFGHIVSPGLCFCCHVSPIGHGLYLAKRSWPNSMADASERREPGRRSTRWLRCAVSGIIRKSKRGKYHKCEQTKHLKQNHKRKLDLIYLSDLHASIPKVGQKRITGSNVRWFSWPCNVIMVPHVCNLLFMLPVRKIIFMTYTNKAHDWQFTVSYNSMSSV